mgnify:CR=1 FL=1|jgi:hypothetical protein
MASFLEKMNNSIIETSNILRQKTEEAKYYMSNGINKFNAGVEEVKTGMNRQHIGGKKNKKRRKRSNKRKSRRRTKKRKYRKRTKKRKYKKKH